MTAAEADHLGALVAQGTTVRFTTSIDGVPSGDITMVLYDALLPSTTRHILTLVQKGFYDGTLVHRVVDDFVIQGGDPSGTGQAGSGKSVPFESDDRLVFGGGALGLARDLDRDSGDSQWFITERPAGHLHDPQGVTGSVFGAYALFGQVVDAEGMATVRAIAARAVVPGLDRPIEDIRVEHASVQEWPTGLDPRMVVQAYHEDVATPTGAATLQLPRHVVAGAPFLAHLYLQEPPEEQVIEASLEDRQGMQVTVELVRSQEDRSIYTGAWRVPHAGVWGLRFAGGTVLEFQAIP